MSSEPCGACVGLSVVHRRYVPYTHAHYGGNLVDGAYSLACFGDAATEMCIRTDGTEGLLVAYSQVHFLAPVYGGDVLQVQATLVRVGNRSREITFTAQVLCRARPDLGTGRSEVLATALLATTATGTVVIPR